MTIGQELESYGNLNMDDLTILTCNYNTPDLVINMLKSLKVTASEFPKIMVMNTSKSTHDHLLIKNGVPYYNFRNGIHGEAVNLGLKKIQTRYVLLVDSDIIFLKDFKKAFERFKSDNFTLMGKVVGDVGEKKLYPRVEPWYCFINNEHLKQTKTKFFDQDRTAFSKRAGSSCVYDVGSTMLEDVVKFGGMVADVNLEGSYFKHFGGMSWRAQKYNPNQGDTDIDFGGTHPHRVLFDIAQKVRAEYEAQTDYLKDVDIKGVFEYA